MTEAQIKYMTNRFLGWKLPDDFSPDGGVSFQKLANQGTPHEHKFEPVGTNLLSYTQAEAMIRNMIEGMPSADANEPRPMRDYTGPVTVI